MSKITIGDYVYVDYLHKNGTVIGDRGGYVGRWTVKHDDGDVSHVSTRDCVIIKPANKRVTTDGRLSADEKVDLLIEYFGLKVVVDEPRLVEVKESK
jgi:hypothetical protein